MDGINFHVFVFLCAENSLKLLTKVMRFRGGPHLHEPPQFFCEIRLKACSRGCESCNDDDALKVFFLPRKDLPPKNGELRTTHYPSHGDMTSQFYMFLNFSRP